VGMGRRKQVAGQRSPSHQRRTWEFFDVLSHSGADVAGIVLKLSEVESAVPACVVGCRILCSIAALTAALLDSAAMVVCAARLQNLEPG